MARKSRNVSPGDTSLRVCNSVRSTASFASTMMLFTPSKSMKLIISFCAPAVIDSIATTAPTPKIMPSIVSRLRSLCTSRLDSPIVSSGKYPLRTVMANGPRKRPKPRGTEQIP